jgi:hypothetical protein
MPDTTIKVDSAVRDRLAVLAAQRGATIRDLVTELAASTPTREELAARHARATTYLREQLCPELDDHDLAGGERFWRELETRRVSGAPLDDAYGGAGTE